jgi:GNAT superfamily N-acetyltransferase
MIGIIERLQGNKIGKALMLHAFAKTLEVAEHIGVYALTLEAINDQKAATYKKWGFTPFIEGELLMFIPVATIRTALSGAS